MQKERSVEFQEYLKKLPPLIQQQVEEYSPQITTLDELQRFVELLECQNKCCGDL